MRRPLSRFPDRPRRRGTDAFIAFCGLMVAAGFLVVEKVSPRGKKPPGLLAKFCPICGTAYEPPETTPMEEKS